MILATKVRYLTHLARGSVFFWAFKPYKSKECRNDENCFKEANSSNVFLRPGVLKKDILKNFTRPYPEPGKVPLAEKAKASRFNPLKGIRQSSPVS